MRRIFELCFILACVHFLLVWGSSKLKPPPLKEQVKFFEEIDDTDRAELGALVNRLMRDK